jgi:ketosteroid isomerase-like protein
MVHRARTYRIGAALATRRALARGDAHGQSASPPLPFAMNDSIDLVRGLYAAFAAGDVPKFLASLHPQVRWNEAEGFPLADRNPYVGIEALTAGVFARLGDFWRDFRVEVGEIVGGGAVVTMFGRYRGTGVRTGKPLDAQVAHTFWLEHGKVVRFQQMVDTAQVRASLA